MSPLARADRSNPLYTCIHSIWVFCISLGTYGHTPLRKHAYSNILKILPLKKENFQIKNSDIFHISAQSIDYGYSLEPPRRGGSNEYHNLCFEQKYEKKCIPL